MNPPNSSDHLLRRLVFLYFWLLIFEGALRKWILPSLSTPLLIIRDPVVIAIYLQALIAGKWRANPFYLLTACLAAFCFLCSFAAGCGVVITVYGMRTDFLHLPLIFLMPSIINREDVERIGKWVIMLAPFMAILALLQFRAGPLDRLNAGAGASSADVAGQLVSSGNHIRPAGTFSFVTGMVSYLTMLCAFLLSHFFSDRKYPRVYIFCAAPALILALAVSGSRSAVLGVALVVLAGVFACIQSPERLGAALRPAILAMIFFAFLTGFADVREGMAVNQGRFEGGGGMKDGIFMRWFGDLVSAWYSLSSAPLLGHGLGMGTNAAAGITSGARGFLLAEGDLARVILESGPVLGLAFILLRTAIMLTLIRRSLMALKDGEVLPILLTGSCFLDLFMGQWGQPTTLGFSCLTAGLAFAATNQFTSAQIVHETTIDIPPETPPQRRLTAGRGRFAISRDPKG